MQTIEGGNMFGKRKKLVGIFLLFFFILVSVVNGKNIKRVYVKKENRSWKLYVGNSPYFVKGFCYSPVPIGRSYEWGEKGIYRDKNRSRIFYTDFQIIKYANANTVRIYNLWPIKWLNDIYRRFKIRFIITLWMGHFGMKIGNKYIKKIDYSNPQHRKAILNDIIKNVNRYKDSPAVLLYLLGNENNYLFNWQVEATGAFVADEKHIKEAKAYYSLVNKAAQLIHKIDKNHPVALGNGDLLYIDIISRLCKDIDIMGANVYRGKGFGNLFKDVKRYLDKPFLFTELGCDALNAISKEEVPDIQAEYVKNQWIEIYNNAGEAGEANCIGGTHFEYVDEWWKSDEKDPANWWIHNKHSSWPSEGYLFDNKAGNNMSEEWFGILRQKKVKVNGVNKRIAREAYFILKDIWSEDPY